MSYRSGSKKEWACPKCHTPADLIPPHKNGKPMVCLNCIDKVLKERDEKFIKTLSEAQKKSYEQLKRTKSYRTSYNILSS